MNQTVVALLLGGCVGAVFSIVAFSYLYLSRPYRKVRNVLALGLAYLLFGGGGIGCIFALRFACNQLKLQPIHNHFLTAVLAFTLILGIAEILGLTAEYKWRKSVGLGARGSPHRC